MSITRSLSFARNTIPTLLATTLVLGLTACGGGGSSSSASTSTLISGSVFAAAVEGATCEIQDANGVTLESAITTDANGQYSVMLDNTDLTNDLMLVCSGGTYTDEASGNTETAGTMAAYVAGGTLNANTNMHATPESTIIHRLVTQHSKTLTQAQTAFTAAFGYTPDASIKPADATAAPGTADNAQLLAGLHAAAFSQLTTDLSLTPAQQFALLNAIAADLSVGTLDGVGPLGAVDIDGSTNLPLNIQNQFNTSLLKFYTDSKNLSGLGNDKIGILPFAKTTLTNSYKVEYIPGMMAMQGKTQFKVRLTNLNNNQPGVGQTVTLMPMMHMATMTHSTPVDGSCIESSTAGTYDCTVYYLMASVMMNDMSMGYWDLKVMIGGMNGEMAHFFPPVMMAMGDTARARLKSENNLDQVVIMEMTQNRDYFLFKSALTSMMGSHNFQLFIAARESMMSFPALATGNTLASNSTEIADLSLSTILVEVSTDGTNWITATEDGNGYWTASNLSDLTQGIANDLYVRLTINGINYTTNGQPVDVSIENGYATFTVTPGGMTM